VCAALANLLVGKKMINGRNRVETLKAAMKIVGSVNSTNFPKGKEFPCFKLSRSKDDKAKQSGDRPAYKSYKPGVGKAIINIMERNGGSEEVSERRARGERSEHEGKASEAQGKLHASEDRPLTKLRESGAFPSTTATINFARSPQLTPHSSRRATRPPSRCWRRGSCWTPTTERP
jgi:hypothetical protein